MIVDPQMAEVTAYLKQIFSGIVTSVNVKECHEKLRLGYPHGVFLWNGGWVPCGEPLEE